MPPARAISLKPCEVAVVQPLRVLDGSPPAPRSPRARMSSQMPFSPLFPLLDEELPQGGGLRPR